ncbi:MAG TPA: ABC transporter substrate-binding protein [Gammaproteobacteria bacterium]
MSQINIMSLRHSAFYSPLLMTMAGKYLEEQGLDYTYTPNMAHQDIVKAIKDNKCHISQSAVAASFAQLESEGTSDVVHFAQINNRDGFFIASREPDNNFNWHKLIGRKVLVDHFFQPYAMLKYGLDQQGIDLSQLQVIDAGDVSEIEKAFRDNKADYVHMQGPYPQQIEHDGLGYVVAAVGDIVGPVAFSSICTSRDWLTSDMAKAFMAAYRKSMNHVMNASADEITQQLHSAGFFKEIDAGVLSNTIEAYQQLGCWQSDVEISRESYDKLLDVFLFSRVISKKHPYESIIVKPPV